MKSHKRAHLSIVIICVLCVGYLFLLTLFVLHIAVSTQCTFVHFAHIIWFEVHLIKFYMIISSHFDDHQLRLGVLVTLGLVCNSFKYSLIFVVIVVFFFPLDVVVVVVCIVVLIAFLHLEPCTVIHYYYIVLWI